MEITRGQETDPATGGAAGASEPAGREWIIWMGWVACTRGRKRKEKEREIGSLTVTTVLALSLSLSLSLWFEVS